MKPANNRVRHWMVRVHRYVGLAMAGFLVLVGLTGSIIAFQAEIDAWLNPRLFRVVPSSRHLDIAQLTGIVEAADPRVRATYIVPAASPDGTTLVTVEPRIDPRTGHPFQETANQFFVNPATGELLGVRQYGAWRFDAAHIVPFIVVLHYSLHMPERWGDLLLGIIAMAWLADCFVGLYVTLPPASRAHGGRKPGKPLWQRWKHAWRIKWGGSPTRINLDLHRAGGLWAWTLLLVLAMTSIAMNLRQQVFQPVVAMFGSISEDISHAASASGHATKPGQPAGQMNWDQAIRAARPTLAAHARGWPVHSLYLDTERGIYRVTFLEPGDRNTAWRMGKQEVLVSAATGAVIAKAGYADGTAADKFLAWQFPLHSGQIAGLAGRIAICITGLLIAMLSVTGVVIWWTKLRGRRFKSRNRRPGQGMSGTK